MPTVAVAGGSGPVGKTIVEALVAHGGHSVHVLSRIDRPAEDGVNFLKMDYSDVGSISQALDEAKIEIVICAIGVFSPEGSQVQQNLILASEKSSSTEKFLVASFDMVHLREHVGLNPLAKYTFEAIDLLDSKTSLTYTRIACGWFADYYGMPHYPSHLHPWINVVNMEKCWAAVPGNGTARADFITTQDMAAFVARLMDLDEWPAISSITGDNMSLNELVQLAEKTRGRKFNVVHDDLDKLKAGTISFFEDFPPIGFENDQAFYALIHYQAGMNHFLVPREGALNEKFPDIKRRTVAEVMLQSWGGK